MELEKSKAVSTNNQKWMLLVVILEIGAFPINILGCITEEGNVMANNQSFLLDGASGIGGNLDIGYNKRRKGWGFAPSF